MKPKEIVILALASLLILLALFPRFTDRSSSNRANTVTIENHTWDLTFIQSDETGAVLGCASEYAEDHKDIENLIVVDLSCDAPGTYFTITDKTNHKTYYFNYEVMEESSGTIIYNIKSDISKGIAVTSATILDDGTSIPTLVITINDYTLSFQDP